MFSFFKKKSASHGSDREDALRVLSDNSPFAVKEAFRSVYTNLIYMPIEDKCKKFVITSPCAGEGKTYVSINLAITIAQNLEASRVLLIDGDIRSPRIEKLISTGTHVHGISEYLAGIDERPNFCDTKVPNLKVLYSGARSANPSRLINTERMNKLFELCDERFDYVIIDTPPLNLVSDALLFSDKVSSYLLVARADYSDVNTLSLAISRLEQVEAEVGGIILCNVNPKRINGKYGTSTKYGRYRKFKYGVYDYYGK